MILVAAQIFQQVSQRIVRAPGANRYVWWLGWINRCNYPGSVGRLQRCKGARTVPVGDEGGTPSRLSPSQTALGRAGLGRDGFVADLSNFYKELPSL